MSGVPLYCAHSPTHSALEWDGNNLKKLTDLQEVLEIKDTHRPYGGPMLLSIGLP